MILPINLDLIEWRARQTPQRPALWFDGRELSYHELSLRARRLAQRLRERGVHRGDRVAILALNHQVHIDLLLAAPKLGIVCIPLNYRMGRVELQAAVTRVAPALLFADGPNQPTAKDLGLPWFDLSTYEDWLAAGDDNDLQAEGVPLTAEDPHMILFTSGSTGIPKAAVLPYRQTIGNAFATAAAWGLADSDCAIQCTPCFHAALNVLTVPLLAIGGRVVLMPRFVPADYLALAEQQRVSLLFMVPTMYRLLAADPAFATADLRQVRWALSGGAPCPTPVHQTYAQRGIAFRQGYGMTEAGVNCFVIETEEARREPESIGRPMPTVLAVIRHPDGRECAVDETGELTLAGPQIFSGYYGDAAETAGILRDGWLWTGDLMRENAEGLFYVCGRRKEMYISGGENIYPLEIEKALAQCPAVMECAVFGWPDSHWGERGVAVVALHPGAAADAASLNLELRTRLAGYKVPADIMIVPELPKTGSQKIDRAATRMVYQTRCIDVGVAA